MVNLAGDLVTTVDQVLGPASLSPSAQVALLFQVDRATRLSQVSVNTDPGTQITIALNTVVDTSGGLLGGTTTNPSSTTLFSQTFTAPGGSGNAAFVFQLNPQFNLAAGRYALVIKSPSSSNVYTGVIQGLTSLLQLSNTNAGVTVLGFRRTTNSGSTWCVAGCLPYGLYWLGRC